MTTHLHRTLAIGLLATFLSSCSDSTNEQVRVIEDHWGAYKHEIFLGRFYTIIDVGTEQPSSGAVKAWHKKRARAWAAAGLVKMTDDGHRYKVEAAPGITDAKILMNDEPWILQIDDGSFLVTSVVDHEVAKRGANKYSVLKIKYDALYTPNAWKLRSALGSSVAMKRKGVCLVKWDDFSKAWKYVTCDVSDLDQPFSTSTVEKFLK